MSLVIALLVGVLLGVGLGVAAAVTRPHFWQRVLAAVGHQAGAVPVFDDGSGPAAMDPADPDLPDAVDATEVAKIQRIPDKQLRRLVTTLSTWRPKRHKDEGAFQRAFQRHLRTNGYGEEEVQRHAYLKWTAEDRDPNSGDKRAVPDFQIAERVLVELKKNVEASSEGDRALGQMSRYCVAWRRRGPALLVVCNKYDSSLRTFIERTVRGWKAQGVPVMAYFAHNPKRVEGDDEFPVGTFSVEDEAVSE